MPAIPDDELPTRMQRGDEIAFDFFASRFGPRFRRMGLVNGLGEADAETLAVNCVSDIAMKVHRFQPGVPGDFERWIFRIVRNALVDLLRARGRTESLRLDLADAKVDWCGPPAEVLEVVNRAVEALGEPDSKIIRMREFEGLSYAEIGQQIDMKAETVRVRRHRALKQLAGQLEIQPAIRSWRTGGSSV